MKYSSILVMWMMNGDSFMNYIVMGIC